MGMLAGDGAREEPQPCAVPAQGRIEPALRSGTTNVSANGHSVPFPSEPSARPALLQSNAVAPKRVVLSDHARWEAGRRELAEEMILRVAGEPEQTESLRPGREVRQSQVVFPPENKTYVVRTIVDLGDDEDVIVTVYRTSKIGKYWRSP